MVGTGGCAQERPGLDLCGGYFAQSHRFGDLFALDIGPVMARTVYAVARSVPDGITAG